MNDFIYQVSFREPPIEGDTRTEFYFFSLAAIYEVFTAKQVGCGVSTLWNIGVSKGNKYTNRAGTCSVTREPIARKPQNRPARAMKTSER